MTQLGGVRLVVVDECQFGPAAADVVLSGLPDQAPVLGVATGATPLPLYRELGRLAALGTVDLSSAALVALDEYVGMGQRNPRSYAAYVHDVIATPLGVDPTRVLVPDGLAADPDAEAEAFERAIVALGGVDVQVAGLGANGHLAFNEPGSALDSTTRTVELSAVTRHDNARFFGGRFADVPTRAISQGLATIGRARSIVLLVRGEHKAEALKAALDGPVTPAVPASILQRHPAATVIADRAAAGLLPLEEDR